MTIVYPPENHSTESEKIFFIGAAKEWCFINGKEIELLHEGNFCPIFNLNLGRNVFVADVDEVEQKFVIERKAKQQKESSGFLIYDGAEVPTEFSKICLDAGHGGDQAGSCSPKGITEKDLNLILVGSIAEELEKKGFDFVLTREEDLFLPLEKRVEISKQNNCDLFISIHHNAIPDDQDPLEYQGISAHYYYEHSKELALALSQELSEKLGMENRSAIQQDLYVTRENKHCQAILLECGYLIHPEESELIVSREFQLNLAKYLADFLSRFIKNS